MRQNKKNKKEARTHKGGQEIFQKTKRVHESTLRLKKFDEIDKSEIRQQELQYTFQYSVPYGIPSSLEASPTEYCNFEVGYFLEAHLLPSGSNKDKRVSTSHQIQVISMPNVQAMLNQEHERQFKIKGFLSIFRARQFTCKAVLATN